MPFSSAASYCKYPGKRIMKKKGVTMVRILVRGPECRHRWRAVASARRCEPATFSAERMWGLQRLGTPALSPDGTARRRARHPLRPRREQGPDGSVAVPGGGRFVPAAHQRRGRGYAAGFSPDGKSIAFVSKRGADRRRRSTSSPWTAARRAASRTCQRAPSCRKWFPDGRRIAFVSSVWHDLVRWEDQAQAPEGARRDESERPRLGQRADRLLGSSPRRSRASLFAVDVDGRGEPLAITRGSGFALPRTEADELLV